MRRNLSSLGFIYAIQRPDGAVKIGASWNPVGRHAALQREWKRPLTILSIAAHEESPCIHG